MPASVAIVTGGRSRDRPRGRQRIRTSRAPCRHQLTSTPARPNRPQPSCGTAWSDAMAVAGSVCDKSCMRRLAAEAMQRWGRTDRHSCQLRRRCCARRALAEIAEEESGFRRGREPQRHVPREPGRAAGHDRGALGAESSISHRPPARASARSAELTHRAPKAWRAGSHQTSVARGRTTRHHCKRRVPPVSSTPKWFLPRLPQTQFERYAAFVSCRSPRTLRGSRIARGVSGLDDVAYITGASLDINGGDLTI